MHRSAYSSFVVFLELVRYRREAKEAAAKAAALLKLLEKERATVRRVRFGFQNPIFLLLPYDHEFSQRRCAVVACVCLSNRLGVILRNEEMCCY